MRKFDLPQIGPHTPSRIWFSFFAVFVITIQEPTVNLEERFWNNELENFSSEPFIHRGTCD